MKCYLCNTTTHPVPGAGEFKRVKCSKCGVYRISKAALDVLRTSPEMNYQVDVIAQRSWLNNKRKTGCPEPSVGSRELKLVRRQLQTSRAG